MMTPCEQDTAMSVEYFDEPSLKHFLRNGEKHVTSVCQRWIVPKVGGCHIAVGASVY